MNQKSRIPESELIPIIRYHQNKIAPQTEMELVEVESGYGIADVVFYSLDKNSITARKQKNISRMKSYEILETLSYFNRINKSRISITQLYEKLPYAEKHFRTKLLPFLIKNEFCIFDKKKYLSHLWKYEVSLKETVAIEAKVNNWRRGLYQAYRYRSYADYSYLAVHSNFIASPLKNIVEFKKANVGLLSVDTKKDEVTLLYKPKKEKMMNSTMFKMYTNEFILHHLKFID